MFDLLYGMGVALSPTPIMVAIVMLFTGRARNNSLAFLAGWVFGLVVLGLIISILVQAGIILLQGTSAASRPVLTILLGMAMTVLGLWQLRRRSSDSPAEVPGWAGKAEEPECWQECLPGRR